MNSMQFFPSILTLLLLTGCRKFHEEKKTSSAIHQTSTCSGTEDLEEFMCIFPITAEFPGGDTAWRAYLQQNLVYPASAVDANIEGTVIVQFIVWTDGTLRNIEAVSGPEELKQSAVDVFMKSPNWNPSIMNGRRIKDYKRQPILFRLSDE